MTLANTARRLNASRIPRLILVTDEIRLSDPLAAIRRLPRGSAVLLRHYGSPERLKLARIMARLTRIRRLYLLVAADWRLAARLGADGVHLPEGLARHAVLAPALGWRRRANALLTVACHSPPALARARALGADAAVLSPVFPTQSHSGAKAIGPLRFAQWSRRARMPVIALGGITGATARRLPPGTAAGLAAIGALA
ncbi:Thiamine monophosphate synthase [Candidatus Terasakiella magnetica]|nr:Thiamine monophosphate synthase [Candidatus Terasakiella magnetica]